MTLPELRREGTAQEEEQRRFFEDYASRYDNRFLRSRWPRNQQLKARVVAANLGDALDGGLVVELGCGTCQVAAELLRMKPEAKYVGLDLSAAMLAAGRRRLEPFGDRVELRQVRGPLPLQPGEFTALFGIDTLHHVDDPVRVLRELRSSLRPGAPMVFLEGNPRFPVTTVIALLQREEQGLFKMTFSNLRAWPVQAGFENVSVEYGPLYTPPGPPRLVPVLDAVDRAFGAVPLLRSLAIFYTARAQAPAG